MFSCFKLSLLLLSFSLFQSIATAAECSQEKNKIEKNGEYGQFKKVFNDLLPALFPIIKEQKSRGFTTNKCNINQGQWIGLLLFKQSFLQQFHFDKRCDLDGSFTPQIDKEFDVDLQLQNLKEFKRAKLKLVIKLINMQTGLIRLKIVCKNGTLFSSKDTIQFYADYSVLLNPIKKKIIDTNEGGTFRLISVNKKKVGYVTPMCLGK